MLLFGGIHRVFSKEFHGLTATDQLAGAGMDHFDDIAADFTLVDLQFFRHVNILFLGP
jgi:hypothetical protein